MTLRARLLISLGALLAVVLLATGATVVGVTRASLVEQVDAQLLGARAGDVIRPGGGGPLPTDPTGRRIALIVVAANGRVIETLPSGFGRAPDPPPDIGGNARELPLGRIVERPSTDGSLHYRVIALEAPGGARVVLGAPLRDVQAAMQALVRNLLAIGAVAMLALGIAGWLIVRRGLRPLESVTATADRIAAGDLRRRVGMPADGSEVGRLGAAFDSMLDQIERAFGDQRTALEAKEASEARLRQFVADASHELRTPLTALRGYADLYQAGGLEDRATLTAAMARIGGESRRMATLVEDMLLLARLDQGRPLRHDRVSMSELVADAVADARALEPARPMTLTAAPGITVNGDEDRLRQVIGNLLANVRVHTSPETPVEVLLEAADGRCLLVVADHGPGIPPEHAGHVFDRFYRADPGRSRDRGGSGLGLAICAAIVQAHGGVMRHRPTPGGGATLTVNLPRAE